MRPHARSLLFSAVAALVFLSGTVYGQRATRDQKKEELIRDKLAAIEPGAVEAFRSGTEAMDKGDYSQAAPLFREVLKQKPNFSPALRRLGFCLARLGQTEDALTHLRVAVAIERSPENLASLAQVLAFPAEGKEGTDAEKQKALALAKEAASLYKGSDDPSYSTLVAQLALRVRNEADFRQATNSLLQKYPDLMVTHYFHAIQLAMDESWIGAEDEIKKAERLGLPPQAAAEFLGSGIHSRATAWRFAHYALYVVAAWVCGLLLLFVAGKVFTQLTLRFMETADPNFSASRAETALRRYYRALINVAGSYYYFSVPIVIFLVIAVTGSVVYGLLMMGHTPIKLVAILVIGALVTVYKMIQSLFIKVNSQDPGRSLHVEEAPGLWNLTREVAENLGTRPLDEIRVTPGTEMAVYERGSYQERRNDMAHRILVMGLGLVPGFGQNPFRAVLAHEYGHLSHRDTAGGDVALRVNQDMMKFAYAMAYAGQAVWWNIAFQFLRLYHFLFRRISHGATRLQEVLADRAAARVYGPQTFEEGLRHVVRRQIEFGHSADKEIQGFLSTGKPLQNIYALETQVEKTIEQAIEEALNRETSEDDTHPSPVDRFRLVSRVVCQQSSASAGPMWDLFANREAISKEMSSQIEKMVKAANV